MKYNVTLRIIGYSDVLVEADNLEEAKRKAVREGYEDADFGILKNIDADIISMCDENGKEIAR